MKQLLHSPDDSIDKSVVIMKQQDDTLIGIHGKLSQHKRAETKTE